MKLALGLDVQTNAKGGKIHVHRGLPSGRAGVQGGRGSVLCSGRHRQHDRLPEALSGARWRNSIFLRRTTQIACV